MSHVTYAKMCITRMICIYIQRAKGEHDSFTCETGLIAMRGRHIRMHDMTHSYAWSWHVHAWDMTQMGWLRLVGSIKLLVSFAKEPYKRNDILQKRPIILSILLSEATTYREESAYNIVYSTQPLLEERALQYASMWGNITRIWTSHVTPNSVSRMRRASNRDL